MYKIIFALSFLLLAPISVFGQCCSGQQEVYYSDIFIDDSQSDPADQTTDGVLYLDGISYVDPVVNIYNHSYGTVTNWIIPDGGGYFDYEIPFTESGNYTLASDWTVFCPVCNCSWEVYGGVYAYTIAPSGYTELYYNNPEPVNTVGGVTVYGYHILS